MAHATKASIGVVPPGFQVFFMVITTILLTMSVAYSFKIFDSDDGIPIVQKPTLSSSSIVPALVEEIDIGFYIDSIDKFDIIKNEFVFNGKLWFVLNPGIVPLDVLGKFDIRQGKILSRSTPIVKMLRDKLFVQYDVQIDFSTLLKYVSYPLDDHYISFQITHDFIVPRIAIFTNKVQNYTINPAAKIYGWDLVEKGVTAGYFDTYFDVEDPQKASSTLSAVFILGYSCVGLRSTMSIFLPLILIFFVSLLCLSFVADQRITMAVGSLTALLAYRFVIDTISPTVGYFTLTDFLFFGVLLASFIIFFIIILDSFGFTVSLSIKKWVIALLHIGLVGMIMYLILW